MRVEKEFEEFIKLLNKNKVEFIIVGAYALAWHSIPRNTGDIDFFVSNSKENAARLITALKEFGFGSIELEEKDFENEDLVIQLGVPPKRIDILCSITGVGFKQAYETADITKMHDEEIRFISKSFFIQNKKGCVVGGEKCRPALNYWRNSRMLFKSLL